MSICSSVVQDLKVQADGEECDLCLIGNKGAQFFRSYGGNVVASSSHVRIHHRLVT